LPSPALSLEIPDEIPLRTFAAHHPLLAAGVAHAADENTVKKNVESFLNAPAVESIKKTPTVGCTKSC
jgi:hypothetical protein